jgi:molecular chaperone Hsp33
MSNDTHESITLTPVSTDTLQKFIFDNAAVRGELVEISDTWREIQNRHDYPPAVRTVLGEMSRPPRCCRPT